MLLEQLGYSLERCSSDAGHWSWKFSALAGQFSWSLRDSFESGGLAFFALTQCAETRS